MAHSFLAPWGYILAIDPTDPSTPASLRVLRRSALRIMRTTIRQAGSAAEAAEWLGLRYRSLRRIVDQHPDLQRQYERAALSEHRAKGATP